MRIVCSRLSLKNARGGVTIRPLRLLSPIMMERAATSRLVMVAAGVTALVLFAQVALINAMSGVYLDSADDHSIALASGGEEAEEDLVGMAARGSKAAVFQQLPTLPVVLMHGMGDAAGNPGMRRIQKAIQDKLGVHVASIQIGNSVQEDIKNSYLITMDEQVAIFASNVQKDPLLAGGFNAAGFSQGNLLIRAYIERYNNPPVINFVSFHGPLAGVGALPQCAPTAFICKEIDKLIGDAVYSSKVQDHIAQSNYFRDPLKITEYLNAVHFLPDINNERSVNATYRENFIQLQNLVLVRANGDTQVFPKESEWFGAYEDNEPYKRVLGFNETAWYREDSFGLKTLDAAGKVHFLSTEGNHLQFSIAFLLQVIEKYFAPSLLA